MRGAEAVIDFSLPIVGCAIAVSQHLLGRRPQAYEHNEGTVDRTLEVLDEALRDV